MEKKITHENQTGSKACANIETQSEIVRQTLVNLVDLMNDQQCREMAEGLKIRTGFLGEVAGDSGGMLRTMLRNTIGIITEEQCQLMINRLHFK